MDFREWQIYHQIHPLKLATDIAVTPLALYLVWEHRVAAALIAAFLPPIVVSLAMLKWMRSLEALRHSAPGRYVRRYMTPMAQTMRLVSLVPMAYGAWQHELLPILAGFTALGLAWGYGLIHKLLTGTTR